MGRGPPLPHLPPSCRTALTMTGGTSVSNEKRSIRNLDSSQRELSPEQAEKAQGGAAVDYYAGPSDGEVIDCPKRPTEPASLACRKAGGTQVEY
jgi:hypothetical protein